MKKKPVSNAQPKQLQPYGKALKLDSARHCQMWQLLTIESTVTAKTFGRLGAAIYGARRLEVIYTICALPGVFSQNRLRS